MLVEALAKIILLPPFSLLLLAALGAWVFMLGRKRVGACLMGLAWALCLLLATPITADMLIAPLEQRYPALTKMPDGMGAIVVLGAGTREDPPEYSERFRPDYVALARAEYAAHLARATGLPLLVSGGGGSGEALANVLAQEAGLAVPMRELASQNTAQNAVYSTRLLRARGIDSIVLVTDAMHMPRAVKSFKDCGVRVTPAPTMFLAASPKEPSTAYDFVPSAQTLRAASYALYEWMGLGWYGLRASGCVARSE